MICPPHHGGQQLRTFSLHLAPPPTGSYDQEHSVRAYSRKAVCRPQADVDIDLQAAMERRLFPASSGIPSPIGINRHSSAGGTGRTVTGSTASASTTGALRPDPHEGEPLPEDEPEEWLREDERAVSAARPAQESTNAGGQEKRPAKRPTARGRSTAAERQIR